MLGPIFGHPLLSATHSANGAVVVVPGTTAKTAATPTIKSVAEAARAATQGVAAAAATDLSGISSAARNSHGSSLPSLARMLLIFIVALALLGVLLGPRLPFLQGAEDEFELTGKNPLLQRLRRRQRGVVIAPGGNAHFGRAPNPQ